mgnify:CR=1 FL=1
MHDVRADLLDLLDFAPGEHREAVAGVRAELPRADPDHVRLPAGFGEQRQPPQAFDQQPVEATATIAACLTALRTPASASNAATGAESAAAAICSPSFRIPSAASTRAWKSAS